jgi:hypothetical protein
MSANPGVPKGTPPDHAGRRRARGWRPCGRLLAVAAGAAMVAGAVLGPVLTAGPASAASRLGWIMGAGNVHLLGAQDRGIASHFIDTPASFGTGASLVGDPIQPGLRTTPVLAYTSYAQFSSDIRNHRISFPYRWVMYDPEAWNRTPLGEQQDPVKYMTLFGQLAHAHRLKVIMAPGMSLGYVHGSVIPRPRSESIAAWYVHVNLAGAAAASSDIYDLQSESQTGNLTEYDWLFHHAAAQARAASPRVQVFAEVSTVNGSAGQMAAAARSISPDGFYVAAPGAIGQADQFFQKMKAAGY